MDIETYVLRILNKLGNVETHEIEFNLTIDHLALVTPAMTGNNIKFTIKLGENK